MELPDEVFSLHRSVSSASLRMFGIAPQEVPMAISSKDIVPLSKARAALTEQCDEVSSRGREKIITKNGESCAALIDAKRLDHYHQLEREHIHLTLLDEAVRALDALKAGKTLTLAQLKSRHGR